MTASKLYSNIDLPKDIMDALLDGCEVHIKPTKKEGNPDLLMKITFQRVKTGGTYLLKKKTP